MRNTSFTALGLVCTLGAALGCAVPGDEGEASVPLGERREEIVGGTVASGDPAVVAVSVGGMQYCTGTLVAPRTVLTAAHCVYAYGTNHDYNVLFGTYSSSPTAYAKVVAQHRHPSYGRNGHDIGVLRLASPAAGVRPIELNTVPLTGQDVGKPIRHVGFGVTSGLGGGGGTKREVTYTVRKVGQLEIESGASGKQTCGGDSGGPAFMVTAGSPDERVAGVVSYGDQDCTQVGVDSRVDVDVAWIKSVYQAWEAPTCQEDGACVPNCAPVDPDCACARDNSCNPECPDLLKDPDCPRDCVVNGICAVAACPRPDTDCVAEGQRCTAETQCKTRQCVSDPQHSGFYCSRTCSNSSECPQGMECAASRVCLYPQKEEKGPGEPCDANTYCRGTVCTGAPGESLRCLLACATLAECPKDHTCESGTNGVRYCQPPEPVAPPPPRPIVVARAPTELTAEGCSSSGSGTTPLALLALAGLWAGRRRKTRAAAAGVLGALLASCAGVEPEATLQGPALGRGESAIVGGQIDNGDPEVFMLLMEYGNGTQSGCTATLIARRTLLTAAHCVDPRIGNSTTIRIWAMNKTAVNQATNADLIRITETRTHPTWNPSVSLSGDIAMALLERAPTTPIKPWNTASVSGFGGRPLRAVGYGTTGPSGAGSGVKRTADLTFRQLSQTHIFLGDQVGKGVCHGDSGGPSFHTFTDGVERVVGVHSYTSTEACVDGGDIRVDAYQPFITQWLSEKEGPQCEKDGRCQEGCTPVDADCVCKADGVCNVQCQNLTDDPDCPKDCVANGVCAVEACPVPDVDCVPEGSTCDSELRCRGRQCISDPQHPGFYCSKGCAGAGDCPNGMECANKVCRFAQLPEVGPGARCTTGQTHCSGGLVCEGRQGEPTTCQKGCVNDGDCPDKATCETGENGARFCREPVRPVVLITRAKAEAPYAGGCSAGGASGLSALAGMVVIAALGRRRRR